MDIVDSICWFYSKSGPRLNRNEWHPKLSLSLCESPQTIIGLHLIVWNCWVKFDIKYEPSRLFRFASSAFIFFYSEYVAEVTCHLNTGSQKTTPQILKMNFWVKKRKWLWKEGEEEIWWFIWKVKIRHFLSHEILFSSGKHADFQIIYKQIFAMRLIYNWNASIQSRAHTHRANYKMTIAFIFTICFFFCYLIKISL